MPRRRSSARLRRLLTGVRGCARAGPRDRPAGGGGGLAEAFAARSYVSLGPILTAREVQRWQRLYDRDREDSGPTKRWVAGGVQSVNYDVLLSAPEFAELVRHPTILAALGELMAPGEEPVSAPPTPTCPRAPLPRSVCPFPWSQSLDEISLRHMAPSTAAAAGADVHQECAPHVAPLRHCACSSSVWRKA